MVSTLFLVRILKNALVLAAITLPAIATAGNHQASAAAPRAAVVSRVKTEDPVVFVTIDDGFYRTRAASLALKRYSWPVTSFVLPRTMGPGKTEYFANLGSGNSFGNHTFSHRNLKGLSLARQKKEICRADRAIERFVGDHTTLFRPPYGSYDNTTLRAAAECGMTHVVLWRVTLAGRNLRTWGGPIRRGDIILLHYIQSLGESLDYLHHELDRLGLKVADLNDYLR